MTCFQVIDNLTIMETEIIRTIQQILAFAVIAVFIFNLTQRKYQKAGAHKRFASLYIAIMLTILYGATFIITEYNAEQWVLIPAAAGAVFLGFWKKDKIFIFSRNCTSCGKPMQLTRTLYFDSNRCQSCDGH